MQNAEQEGQGRKVIRSSGGAVHHQTPWELGADLTTHGRSHLRKAVRHRSRRNSTRAHSKKRSRADVLEQNLQLFRCPSWPAPPARLARLRGRSRLAPQDAHSRRGRGVPPYDAYPQDAGLMVGRGVGSSARRGLGPASGGNGDALSNLADASGVLRSFEVSTEDEPDLIFVARNDRVRSGDLARGEARFKSYRRQVGCVLRGAREDLVEHAVGSLERELEVDADGGRDLRSAGNAATRAHVVIDRARIAPPPLYSAFTVRALGAVGPFHGYMAARLAGGVKVPA